MISLGIHDTLLPHQESVVTVGNFDGIHRGHALLINEVVGRSKEKGQCSVVVTFQPHTRFVVFPELSHSLLTTHEEKEILISSFGVDYLYVIPFDAGFREMSSSEFVIKILKEKLHATSWVMGEGHSVGRNRDSNKIFLHEVMSKYHIEIFIANLAAQDEITYSSTQIRKLVTEGCISEAVELLGHPYLVCARRTTGSKVGLRLGYPTFNFRKPPSIKALPPAGVYAAELVFGNVKLKGALYYGNCPTFPERDTHLEFHALDFRGEEPETEELCRIRLYHFIRKDMFFSESQKLKDQIGRDIKHIKNYFHRRQPHGFD